MTVSSPCPDPSVPPAPCADPSELSSPCPGPSELPCFCPKLSELPSPRPDPLELPSPRPDRSELPSPCPEPSKLHAPCPEPSELSSALLKWIQKSHSWSLPARKQCTYLMLWADGHTSHVEAAAPLKMCKAIVRIRIQIRESYASMKLASYPSNLCNLS